MIYVFNLYVYLLYVLSLNNILHFTLINLTFTLSTYAHLEFVLIFMIGRNFVKVMKIRTPLHKVIDICNRKLPFMSFIRKTITFY